MRIAAHAGVPVWLVACGIAAAAAGAPGCHRSSALGEPCMKDRDCQSTLVCNPDLGVCVQSDLPDAGGSDATASDAAGGSDAATPGTDATVPGTDAGTPPGTDAAPACVDKNDVCGVTAGECCGALLCCDGPGGEPDRCHPTCN